MAIRKSIAILTVITAMFAGACETEEDPGTGDVGNTAETSVSPGGTTGQDDGGGY
jgi:hypothetical protein